MGPCIDYLVVTLGIGDETHIIVVGDFLNLLVTLSHDFLLLWRDDDIAKVERQTGNVSHAVTQVLDTVEELTSLCHTHSLDNVGNQATEGLLGNDVIEEAHLLGDNLIDDDTTHGSLDHAVLQFAVHQVLHNHLDRSVEVAAALVVGNQSLLSTIESESLALGTRTELGNIVETQHHIL